MSRGHGELQRWILDNVGGHPNDTAYGLARSYYEQRPTEAQVSAVRRSLRRLAADGLVEGTREAWHGRPWTWRRTDH